MRLWTIHPQYLDAKGLLALWRESLLAQQVLADRTKGYRNHPQLSRFRASPDPLGAIASYLRSIHGESVNRGYQFREEKINHAAFNGTIACTRGQLLYEWNHLKKKLQQRDARKLQELEAIEEPWAHPLFEIIEGDVEAWEVMRESI
jgi:hypothetical protein